GVGPDVQHPARLLPVLGHEIVAPVPAREPDLDLAGLPAAPAGGREVEVGRVAVGVQGRGYRPAGRGSPVSGDGGGPSAGPRGLSPPAPSADCVLAVASAPKTSSSARTP